VPFVEDLVLSVSRDSHGQVAVQVTYTPGYNEVEWSYQIYWNWRVLLIRLPEEPPPGQHPIDAIYGTAKFGYMAIDPAFIVATLLQETEHHAATSTAPAKIPKTITHVLSAKELDRLRVAGREHVYAVVEAIPDVDPVRAYAKVDIDVGDPGE
jgi:hypothetical protein